MLREVRLVEKKGGEFDHDLLERLFNFCKDNYYVPLRCEFGVLLIERPGQIRAYKLLKALLKDNREGVLKYGSRKK